MAEKPTAEDLLEAGTIAWDDVCQAMEAFMADPGRASLDLGAGYSLDLHATIDASVLAKDLLSKSNADDHLRRAAIRSAILLARPEKR